MCQTLCSPFVYPCHGNFTVNICHFLNPPQYQNEALVSEWGSFPHQEGTLYTTSIVFSSRSTLFLIFPYYHFIYIFYFLKIQTCFCLWTPAFRENAQVPCFVSFIYTYIWDQDNDIVLVTTLNISSHDN